VPRPHLSRYGTQTGGRGEYGVDYPVCATHDRVGWETAELPDAIESDFVVDIPPRFHEYLDAALLRIQILYPECQFSRSGCAISVRARDGHSEDRIRKTVLHAVYREKIYAKTLGMRQALVAAVTTR